MVGFSYQIDDAQLHVGLRSLIALGRDAGPIMADIAAIGESSTRMRFRTETGPDGQKWKPSLRARITGGRTLTKDGHLSGSISGRHGRDFAEWGVNRIYAAIHQFGGKSGMAPGPAGIPARPYMGVSPEDLAWIEQNVAGHIERLAAG